MNVVTYSPVVDPRNTITPPSLSCPWSWLLREVDTGGEFSTRPIKRSFFVLGRPEILRSRPPTPISPPVSTSRLWPICGRRWGSGSDLGENLLPLLILGRGLWSSVVALRASEFIASSDPVAPVLKSLFC